MLQNGGTDERTPLLRYLADHHPGVEVPADASMNALLNLIDRSEGRDPPGSSWQVPTVTRKTAAQDAAGKADEKKRQTEWGRWFEASFLSLLHHPVFVEAIGAALARERKLAREYTEEKLAARDRRIKELQHTCARLIAENEIFHKRERLARGDKGAKGEPGKTGAQGRPGRDGKDGITTTRLMGIRRWVRDTQDAYSIRAELTDGSRTAKLDLRPVLASFLAELDLSGTIQAEVAEAVRIAMVGR